MSKAVLLSIRPNWCKMIWAGMKEVEVRKTRPTLETPFKAYIYRSRWLGYEVAQGWRAENGQQSDRRVHLRQNRQARPRRNDDGHKHFDIGRVV